jgi:hypothetical protein
MPSYYIFYVYRLDGVSNIRLENKGIVNMDILPVFIEIVTET